MFSPRSSSAQKTKPAPASRPPVKASAAASDGVADLEVRNLRHHVEASAVHYLQDLDRYLLLSDDTPNKRPMLFLMNRAGVITDEVLVERLNKVNDLEAIAVDDKGRLYLACSQNRSRRGKLKRSRRLLSRVTRKRKRFILDRAVDLHSLLKAAAQASPQASWSAFINAAVDVDVEGLAFYDNALLLGYKEPLLKGHSVILRLGKLDALFAKGQIPAGAVSIFKRLRLQSDGQPQQALSGLLRSGDQLFITSTVKGRNGSLWSVPMASDQPRLIRSFSGLRPEGVCRSAEPSKLLVAFDQGGKAASHFALIEVGP